MDLSEAIRTHVEWKMRLRGAMKSEALLDAGTMERDDHCHFGRWLHGEARDKYGQLKSYPELNHLFMAGSGAASPAEYERPSYVSPEVIDDIVTWLKGNKK